MIQNFNRFLDELSLQKPSVMLLYLAAFLVMLVGTMNAR